MTRVLALLVLATLLCVGCGEVTPEGIVAAGIDDPDSNPSPNEAVESPAGIEDQADDAEATSAAELFERRILPIAKSTKASSCSECHFGGVELQNYVTDDQATTFAALRAAGLIDVEKPDDSKLLAFIGRAPETPDDLMQRVRENELVAFRSWIRAAVRDPKLLAAKSETRIGTELPPEVIRHARTDRVLSMFLDTIWSEVGRCVHCHSPEKNRGAIGRNGQTEADVDAISWVVPNDPEATLRRLVDDGNIDFDDPASSPVLTKPAGLVKHGGGPKFVVGSTTHRNFLAFLEDYAAVVNGEYTSTADLPAPLAELVIPTQQHLRIDGLPESFTRLPMQVDLYRWNDESGAWSTERWGTALNRVNGKEHRWQANISATVPMGTPREKGVRENHRIPPGRYLARVHVDLKGRYAENPRADLGPEELVAEIEFRGDWPDGFKEPKTVRFVPATK